MSVWIYDEQWVNNTMAPVFFELYKQKGRVFGDDPQSLAWPCRVMAGIWQDGLAPQASLEVHANECADALGVPRPFSTSPFAGLRTQPFVTGGVPHPDRS